MPIVVDSPGSSLPARVHWRWPVFIIGLGGLFELAGEPLRLLLRYQREAVASGEWWRFLSGHFVHLGLGHWLLNAAGLLLVWLLVGERYSLRNWGWLSLASLAAMGMGFWFINTDLIWYVGLSGLLHGWLVGGLLATPARHLPESLLLLILLVGKIAYEQLAGPLPGSEASAGGAVLVDAHLYGSIGGLLAAIALRMAGANK